MVLSICTIWSIWVYSRMKSSLLAFILLAFFFTSCGEKKLEPVVDLAEGDSLPSQESWGDTIYFTEQGKLQAILESRHLKEYSDLKTKYLDTIKVRFYKEDKKTPSSVLTADHAVINDKLNKMTAQGNVIVKSNNGRILKTPELVWLSKKNKIYSDKSVWIADSNEVIEGVGFESDKELNNYVIRKITLITSKVK